MADVFPTGRFNFLDQEVNIERQTLTGGTSISGEIDRVSADGGGRVFAQFARGSLPDRSAVLAWRAVTTLLEEGVSPVIVPFCDIRHQPYGPANGSGVPHSDGSPLSDDSLYLTSGGGSVSVGARVLRATTIRITSTLAQPLIGGEWFSIEHPTKDWRAYRIAKLFPVEGSPGQYDLTFRPPLREAVADGEAVELLTPRCLMVQDAPTSTALENRRYTEAAIRFVEAP